MNEQRLILFLELVEGCNNKECPSHGTVCSDKQQNFMDTNTLKKVSSEVVKVLDKKVFTKVDIWTYGNGDSLDHPNINEMLQYIHKTFSNSARISMAIDSRRGTSVDINWENFGKIKLIHKLPLEFDWVNRAKLWIDKIGNNIFTSHKLITNHISNDMCKVWKSGVFSELKAVPWHNIKLGTNNPVFTKRENFTYDKEIPVNYGPYPGIPVRRALIRYNGKLRRCLVSPTSYTTISELLLNQDDVCPTCWPLTGSELAKFYDDRVTITPSANCVSDGYFSPILV